MSKKTDMSIDDIKDRIGLLAKNLTKGMHEELESFVRDTGLNPKLTLSKTDYKVRAAVGDDGLRTEIVNVYGYYFTVSVNLEA